MQVAQNVAAALAAAALIILGVIFYMFRFQMTGIGAQGELAIVVQDRWTGTAQVCVVDRDTPVCFPVFPPKPK
jgi:hypothetical protein